jgi:hypothetical protein
LVIILVDKITTTGNWQPLYDNYISLDLPHDDNPKHMNPIFINLSFLPKSWLLPKKKKKAMKP